MSVDLDKDRILRLYAVDGSVKSFEACIDGVSIPKIMSVDIERIDADETVIMANIRVKVALGCPDEKEAD